MKGGGLVSTYVLALAIGIVVGLRTMTGVAAICWAATLGRLPLGGTWMGFLGATVTPWIASGLALGEIVNDKLPKTPSRKSPGPFAARVLAGAFCGYAIGTLAAPLGGLIAGAIGAVIGTLGGYELRMRLVRRTGGRDLPIALLEDLIAVGAAALVVSRL